LVNKENVQDGGKNEVSFSHLHKLLFANQIFCDAEKTMEPASSGGALGYSNGRGVRSFSRKVAD
jgi:hypothetical protein